eukprot:sb/3471390/
MCCHTYKRLYSPNRPETREEYCGQWAKKKVTYPPGRTTPSMGNLREFRTFLLITQSFLDQFAKSLTHWKEDIETFQMSSRKLKLAQIARPKTCEILSDLVNIYRLPKWFSGKVLMLIIFLPTAHFALIFIFLGSFERSQCPLSNEPKILQIGQEMAELWTKTWFCTYVFSQIWLTFTAYRTFTI